MRCFYKSLAAKFLVFCLAIVEATYNAASAATVNFPPNTPGLVGGGAAVMGAAVPRAHATPNRQFTHIQPPLPAAAPPATPQPDIYFPVNGKQPTTQQAAVWSGARMANDDANLATTEWYMRMFGWVNPAAPAAQLRMGYAPPVHGAIARVPIITFDATMNAGEQENFWKAFRAIAEDSVGRVLLYRLLIEIRRENGGVGCEEWGAHPAARNYASQLVISYKHNHYDWFYWGATNAGAQAEISVCFNLISPGSDVLVARTEVAPSTLFTTQSSSCDMPCALFHEMLHWYQQLRDSVRYDVEYQKPIANIAGNDLSADLGYPVAPAAVPENFLSWATVNAAGVQVIKLDEMRVICGSRAGLNDYLQGDDLSENAFRCSLGKKMRFGHGNRIRLKNARASRTTQKAIKIAHSWALECVKNIVGFDVHWWDLTLGGDALLYR